MNIFLSLLLFLVPAFAQNENSDSNAYIFQDADGITLSMSFDAEQDGFRVGDLVISSDSSVKRIIGFTTNREVILDNKEVRKKVEIKPFILSTSTSLDSLRVGNLIEFKSSLGIISGFTKDGDILLNDLKVVKSSEIRKIDLSNEKSLDGFKIGDPTATELGLINAISAFTADGRAVLTDGSIKEFSELKPNAKNTLSEFQGFRIGDGIRSAAKREFKIVTGFTNNGKIILDESEVKSVSEIQKKYSQIPNQVSFYPGKFVGDFKVGDLVRNKLGQIKKIAAFTVTGDFFIEGKVHKPSEFKLLEVSANSEFGNLKIGDLIEADSPLGKEISIITGFSKKGRCITDVNRLERKSNVAKFQVSAQIFNAGFKTGDLVINEIGFINMVTGFNIDGSVILNGTKIFEKNNLQPFRPVFKEKYFNIAIGDIVKDSNKFSNFGSQMVTAFTEDGKVVLDSNKVVEIKDIQVITKSSVRNISAFKKFTKRIKKTMESLFKKSQNPPVKDEKYYKSKIKNASLAESEIKEILNEILILAQESTEFRKWIVMEFQVERSRSSFFSFRSKARREKIIQRLQKIIGAVYSGPAKPLEAKNEQPESKENLRIERAELAPGYRDQIAYKVIEENREIQAMLEEFILEENQKEEQKDNELLRVLEVCESALAK